MQLQNPLPQNSPRKSPVQMQKDLPQKKHTQDSNPNTEHRKQRSFRRPATELPTYYKRKRSEPTNLVSSWSNNSTTYSQSKLSDTDLIWVFACEINSMDQHIPGLSGWVSVTGQSPKCLTTIGYYPMINAPITDLATIQECLRCSQAASSEAGQEYTISTFNLGVCMKAYVWNEPEKYQKHIILIGTFHCCGAYLKGKGRRYCQGSGWVEVAL